MEIPFGGEIIEQVTGFIYLGHNFIPDDTTDSEPDNRKFANCLYSTSTRQLELLLWIAGPTAQHMQDCPIFFIQLNYVHKKDIRCCHLMLNFPATRWKPGFHFLLINEAM